MSSNFSNDSDESIRVEGQYDGDTPPSIAIVKAIATIENVDPVDSPVALGITLNDQLDPEALDRLVTDTSATTTVTVELVLRNDHRYTVQVRNDGEIVVEKVA